MKLGFRPTPLHASILMAFAAAGLAGCSSSDSTTNPAAAKSPPPPPPDASATFIVPAKSEATACAALKGSTLPGAPANTQVVFSQVVAATATAPEHCEIKGTINANRTGADGQKYTIKWHMRLPAQWNGRFYFGGGGGVNGTIGDAYGTGAGSTSALAQRYAVVTQDSGHSTDPADPDFGAADTSNNSAQWGSGQFGFDPDARLDFGYRSYGWVTEAAKAVLQAYYTQSPYYSYYQGCSEGGREALMMSQRFPEYFDGIVAGNPGMDLPKAAIAEAWDSQQLATAATSLGQLTDSGDPWTANAFSQTDMTNIANAILQACDATDGVVDGMVLNPEKCNFDPTTMGPSGSNKLTAAQVTALQKIFAGAKNSSNQDLYAGWFWDPGIATFGWRIWKLGIDPTTMGAPAGSPKANNSINMTLGGSALPLIFTTPPNRPTKTLQTVTSANGNDAFTKYILSYDMDADAPSIFATYSNFTTSAYDFMYSSSTDYDKFKAHNSRMIVYGGGADPVFSPKYHIAWYKQLMAKYADAQSFARYFLVPGMNHCSGGPATDQFDSFGAVVKWVEKGTAPDTITASVNSGSTDLAGLSTPIPANRTRPLCPYPKFAKWNGAAGADINDAKNFVCE